jgi:GNAT superfamily N-acetyltransferase
MNTLEQHPVTDLALAQRLERAEAKASAAFVESRARVTPSAGAEWRDVRGAYAMFDGVGSPITQTFGLGLFSPPTGDQLGEIEAFFRDRGADVFHEVSPLADPAVLTVLPERGYRPIELTSVMHMPVTRDRRSTTRRPSAELTVRRTEPGEESLWAETMARGWAEMADLGAFMLDFGRISADCEGRVSFLAEWNGAPIAAAAIAAHDGVALLTGASTDPAFRGRGAQAALLDIRLDYAASSGCDLAAMGALPGSASQRNGERQGFRIAYTRIKWHQLSFRAAGEESLASR